MPCLTNPTVTVEKKKKQRSALERLRAAIGAGTVQVVVAKGTGAFALKGWALADREDVSDVCAYRALLNTPEMRRAIQRAQAMANTPLNQQTIASGLHSHDGGSTWSRH
jgi:hypothetical protein